MSKEKRIRGKTDTCRHNGFYSNSLRLQAAELEIVTGADEYTEENLSVLIYQNGSGKKWRGQGL